MTNRVRRPRPRRRPGLRARPRPPRPRRSRRTGDRRSPISSASRATTRLVRSSRSARRPWTIAGGPRPSGSTRRPARWRTADSGPTPSRCSRQASKLDPDSVAIARRLSRIYIGALGRPDLAVEYGKQVLADRARRHRDALPGWSTSTPKQNEPDGRRGPAERGAGQPQARRARAGPAAGRVRAGQALLGPAQAARQGGRRLRQGDRRTSTTSRPTASPRPSSIRILGNDPASAYLNFGMIFLAAKRDDLAVRALERGLVYDEENPADRAAPGRHPAAG